MEPLCQEIDGEFQCHVHPRRVWQLMVGPVLLVAAVLFVLNFTQLYQDAQRVSPWPFAFEILLLNIVFPIVVLVPSYIWIWLGYRNFTYIIKKDELVIHKGIIRKRNNSIPYNKIRNVQRLQSLLERIFGLCTISIETSDVSLEFPNSSIPGMLNSKELPDLILSKTHENRQADTDLGETMRQILLQLKDLNRRDQREEDSKK